MPTLPSFVSLYFLQTKLCAVERCRSPHFRCHVNKVSYRHISLTLLNSLP